MCKRMIEGTQRVWIDALKKGCVMLVCLMVILSGCSSVSPSEEGESETYPTVFDEDSLVTEYVGSLIVSEEAAETVAEALFRAHAPSFDTATLSACQVEMLENDKGYAVSYKSGDTVAYSAELWNDEAGQLTIKEVYIDGKKISQPLITDADHARDLGDAIMRTVYVAVYSEELPSVFGYLYLYEESAGEWRVGRSHGEYVLGGGAHITVFADGIIRDFEWGGE